MINRKWLVILSSLVLVFTVITLFSFLISGNTNKQNGKVINIERSGLLPVWNISKATNESQYIVKGKVESIMPAQWNTVDGKEGQNIQSNDTIYHDVKFKVEKIIKGEDIKDNIITLRIYSGSIEDKDNNIKRLIDKDQPEFSLNEHDVLFLVKDDSEYNKKHDDVYLVYNCINGKYKLDVNTNIVSSKNGEKKNYDKFEEDVGKILKSK